MITLKQDECRAEDTHIKDQELKVQINLLAPDFPKFDRGWPVKESWFCPKNQSVKHYYMIKHNLHKKHLRSHYHSEESVLDQRVNRSSSP